MSILGLTIRLTTHSPTREREAVQIPLPTRLLAPQRSDDELKQCAHP